MGDVVDFPAPKHKPLTIAGVPILDPTMLATIIRLHLSAERFRDQNLKDLQDWSGSTRIFIGEDGDVLIDGQKLTDAQLYQFLSSDGA
ncbi:MAG: hypothetical protein ABSF67_07910 [Roseiarcus sp.]|jgi:hypothetical protein